MAEDRPSIRTVATRAGVSTATVSNVLNLRRNVSPTLAARVHAAVADLGYIADLGAARLRSRRSTVTGVVVPEIANPFFGAFVAELEEQARAAGYDLLIVSSGGDPRTEEARVRTLLTWRPAGLIVVPSDDHFAVRSIVRSAGVPLIVADRIPIQRDFDVVSIDNHAEAAAVMRHLSGNGHRRILVAATDLSIGNMADRLAGCREAARGSADIEVIEAGTTVSLARERLFARLGSGRRPDAIFALTNSVTQGAVGAMAERGLTAPQDLALAGFDDDEWMRVVSPSITAVCQPVVGMARAVWSRLLERIGGDKSPPRDVRLACRLECRQSSAGHGTAHGTRTARAA